MHPQMRLNLYHYGTCSVDQFASHADRLLIRTKTTKRATILSPSNSAEDKNSDQRLINKLIETRLDFLQRNVALLFSDRTCPDNRNTPTESNFKRRNFFLFRKLPFASNNNFIFENSCMSYYHKEYGDRAYKYGAAPCPFAASSWGCSS